MEDLDRQTLMDDYAAAAGPGEEPEIVDPEACRAFAEWWDAITAREDWRQGQMRNVN